MKDFGFRPVFEDFWQVWGLSFLQEHKKRRTRESKTPHAEMPNAARGNCNPRTRRLKSPYRELKITTCRFCNYSVSFLQLQRVVIVTTPSGCSYRGRAASTKSRCQSCKAGFCTSRCSCSFPCYRAGNASSRAELEVRLVDVVLLVTLGRRRGR